MTDKPTPEAVKASLEELRGLVRCRCHEAYKGRGLHDPDCECDSATAVETVAAAYLAMAEEAAGYLAAFATHHATMNGRAPNEFHPVHYDRLKELGARMDGFVRATEEQT